MKRRVGQCDKGDKVHSQTSWLQSKIWCHSSPFRYFQYVLWEYCKDVVLPEFVSVPSLSSILAFIRFSNLHLSSTPSCDKLLVHGHPAPFPCSIRELGYFYFAGWTRWYSKSKHIGVDFSCLISVFLQARGTSVSLCMFLRFRWALHPRSTSGTIQLLLAWVLLSGWQNVTNCNYWLTFTSITSASSGHAGNSHAHFLCTPDRRWEQKVVWRPEREVDDTITPKRFPFLSMSILSF